MRNIHPSCPDCKVEMVEYYVGLVPVGVFLSLDKVATYICKECGRIIFYAKEFPRRYSKQNRYVSSNLEQPISSNS